MAKSNGASGTVIIKKYANRRLYDTSTSSYVTLDHLSDLVRREIDFEVVDAKTGEDLTRQVLTQIIFEKENKGEGALPRPAHRPAQFAAVQGALGRAAPDHRVVDPGDRAVPGHVKRPAAAVPTPEERQCES